MKQSSATQVSGPLYGPPAPHIAFWYGDHYLGETRGNVQDVQAARTKLIEQQGILDPGNRTGILSRLLSEVCRAVLYCGGGVQPLPR